MANPFAQFAQPTSPTPEENPFAQFATPSSVANPFADSSLEGNPFAQFAVEPTQYIDARTKKEAPGFVGSFTSALKERVETAAPAAKLYFGVGDQAKSTEELLAARKKAAEEYKQTEFSDIGEAFRQGNYGDALSKTYDKFKEVAGSSFGAMAPAMGAGAAAAFAAPAAVPAVLAGTAAYGITALGSYIADNIARQKEEQKARGKESEDINRLTASAAATGQTALDIFGFKFFKPLGQLVGLEGKAAADRAAMEIVEAATRPGAYRRAVATGAAKGIAFEVPQEVSQQLLERWQAGLDVNPFTDPTAAKEYLEAAGGALLLGGPMGAASRVAQTRTARKLVGEEPAGEERAIDEAQTAIDAELKSYAEREGAPVEEAGVVVPTQEVSDVTQPTETFDGAVEPSAAMPVGGVEAATAGVETSLASGLATAEQLTGEPITGAAVQPTPLTQPLPTYEEAQAVFDSQPNKEQLEIMEVPDGGFVVAQRAPSVAPPAISELAPPPVVAEAAPVETSGVTSEAVQPAVQVAPAEAVEAAPVPEVTEPVAVTEEAAPAAVAEEVIEEEPSVTEAIETVQAKEERPQETAATVAAIAEQAETPVRKRAPGGGRKKSEVAKTTEERKAQAADLIQDARDIEGRAKAVQKLSLGFAPEQFAKRGVSAEEAQAAYEEAEAARKEDLWNNKMYLYIASVDPTRRNTKAGRIAQEAVAQFTPQEQAQYKELYTAYKAEQRGATRLSQETAQVQANGTPEERQVQSELTGKSLLEAANWTVENAPNKFAKYIAERVRDRLRAIASRGVQLEFNVMGGQQRFTSLFNARGVCVSDWANNKVTVNLNGVPVIDNQNGYPSGMNYVTVLHELIHAATVTQNHFLPSNSPLRKELGNLFNAVVTHFNTEVKAGRMTPFMERIYNRNINALRNTDELIAWGLTDADMQEFLSSIKVGEKTVMQQFVDWIRQVLNINPDYLSALDQLVQTADTLLTKSVGEIASDVESGGKFKYGALTNAQEEFISPLKSTSIYMSDEADPKFGSATTAQQALRRVMNTGKPFEKLLAQRLLNAVKGIQFVVIRPDTKLPAEISKAFKDTTQGVYSEARKTIYVRDESFGDVNGVNNTTILHEALHAATTLRLDYALALAERGELDTAPALQAFAQMMTKTMERAKLVYRVAKAEGRSTPYLDALHKVGAFTDVREFVSYGLTDNMMQQFLATKVPGMKMSMFSRFVEAIRKLFGFDANSQSAFQDLVVTTDALLSERLPRDASIIATTSDTLASIKDDGKKAKDFDTKLRQPLASPEESLTTIGQIIKIRSWADAKDVVSDIYNGTSSQFRRPLLGALTTRQLTELNAAKEMTDADGKPLLDEVLRIAEDMNGAKSKMLDDTAAMAKVWHEWQLANPGKYRTLNRLIHLSTINQIDPSVDTRSATLTQMYEALGEDGKKLYNDIRDFYKARFDKYKQILLDRIAQTEADEATKAQIIAKLEKDFEKLPQPYFPLVREGKYWVRIGNPKSPNMEYYMFEDPRERNFFVRQRAKELGTTVEALKEDESNIFAMGDDFKQAVDEGMRSSKMLKDILELVDNASMADKTALKDEIHQLYFSTLPEQNFRKHFLHRKGTAGFRSDALRNFAKSSFHTSVQLAKIEYGQKLRNSVTRAWDATEGKPQRDTLFRPLYDEMRDRVENVLSPDRSDAMATKFANVLGSASFFYYMSAPASALTNLTGLYVFGMPVLNGEFGAKANLALAKNMNVFKAVGTTDKDGKFTFPTLLSKLTGHRRDAYMEALRRGKIDTTLTYDTLQLSRTPSEKYDGGTVTTKIMNAMGYLFHHSEKINREVMFMTAYDLAYERATKDGRNAKTAQEEALNEASRLTDEAMFDYSEFNKPRFFRGNVARVLLQFKSFAQQTTFYLVKNFRAMFKGADAEVRKTAATKFVGTLGMTAMFAGALGLPLVSVIAYAMSFLTEDDEDPERRNPKFRFKKFLTDTFGENLGLIIERGPVSWATDVDFHSRTKLDQLWFRELKTGKSEPETLREFIINMMGPSVGLGVNVAEAMRRINNGDTQRGMELLLPAGLRGFAVAYRQQGIPFVDKGEGVKTLKGDVVADPEALTEANRIATMAGFGTTRVAAKQEDISQIRAEIDSRTAQRREALDLFKDLLDEFTFGKRDAAVQAVVKYNKANPYDAIDVDTVFSTIEREAEARGKSIDGLRVTDKLRPLVMRMMPSRAPLKKAPD